MTFALETPKTRLATSGVLLYAVNPCVIPAMELRSYIAQSNVLSLPWGVLRAVLSDVGLLESQSLNAILPSDVEVIGRKATLQARAAECAAAAMRLMPSFDTRKLTENADLLTTIVASQGGPDLIALSNEGVTTATVANLLWHFAPQAAPVAQWTITGPAEIAPLLARCLAASDVTAHGSTAAELASLQRIFLARASLQLVTRLPAVAGLFKTLDVSDLNPLKELRVANLSTLAIVLHSLGVVPLVVAYRYYAHLLANPAFRHIIRLQKLEDRVAAAMSAADVDAIDVFGTQLTCGETVSTSNYGVSDEAYALSLAGWRTFAGYLFSAGAEGDEIDKHHDAVFSRPQFSRLNVRMGRYAWEHERAFTAEAIELPDPLIHRVAVPNAARMDVVGLPLLLGILNELETTRRRIQQHRMVGLVRLLGDLGPSILSSVKGVLHRARSGARLELPNTDGASLLPTFAVLGGAEGLESNVAAALTTTILPLHPGATRWNLLATKGVFFSSQFRSKFEEITPTWTLERRDRCIPALVSQDTTTLAAIENGRSFRSPNWVPLQYLDSSLRERGSRGPTVAGLAEDLGMSPLTLVETVTSALSGGIDSAYATSLVSSFLPLGFFVDLDALRSLLRQSDVTRTQPINEAVRRIRLGDRGAAISLSDVGPIPLPQTLMGRYLTEWFDGPRWFGPNGSEGTGYHRNPPVVLFRGANADSSITRLDDLPRVMGTVHEATACWALICWPSIPAPSLLSAISFVAETTFSRDLPRSVAVADHSWVDLGEMSGYGFTGEADVMHRMFAMEPLSSIVSSLVFRLRAVGAAGSHEYVPVGVEALDAYVHSAVAQSDPSTMAAFRIDATSEEKPFPPQRVVAGTFTPGTARTF